MVRDYIEQYRLNLISLIDQVHAESIEKMAGILFKACLDGKPIFIVGNGGSASTATHLACDLSKCTIIPGRRRAKVMSLVDNIPLVSAWTNDNGFETIFEEQLKNWAEEGCVLIAFSVHGGSGEGEAGPWSQNIPRAVEYIRQVGGKVLAFSGFGGGLLAKRANECIVININSEPLGTPLVESIHSILAHLLTQCLRIRLERQEA